LKIYQLILLLIRYTDVEASLSVRRHIRDAPRTECALRIALICTWRGTGNNSEHGVRSLLLLAATAWRFMCLPVRPSNRNTDEQQVGWLEKNTFYI